MRIHHLLSLSLTLAALGFASTAPAADASSELSPTVVMIHGAFADGSSWSKVIPILQAKGVKAIAVQNGLNSLAASAIAPAGRCQADPRGGGGSQVATRSATT
jgi:pimeloyl-ACP methyl ester carboxylesterase